MTSNIEIVSVNNGTVTSINSQTPNTETGTSGLSYSVDPITNTGSISLASGTNAGDVMIWDQTNNKWNRTSITPGTGININNTDGNIEVSAINNGTITSIGSQIPNIETGTSGLSFSTNPITSIGAISLASGTSSGQIMIWDNTNNKWIRSLITQGTGINITNTDGNIELSTVNNGTVTSISSSTPNTETGTSGLSFSTDPITNTGSLSLASGTNLGDIMIWDNTSNKWVRNTLTAGTNVTIDNTTPGQIIINSIIPTSIYSYNSTSTSQTVNATLVQLTGLQITISTAGEYYISASARGDTSINDFFNIQIYINGVAITDTLRTAGYIDSLISADGIASINTQQVISLNIGDTIDLYGSCTGATAPSANVTQRSLYAIRL